MSYLGLQILYNIINSVDDVLCERVFAPWVDMEDLMRSRGMPLFSLENKVPLSEFDIIGFSLQYEMAYTNLLNMLSLSHIPLRSSNRDERFPLIIAGGPCAFNPEPLAAFIDVIFLGEAEDAVTEIINVVRDWKRGREKHKSQLLMELSKIPGVYVPGFYGVQYKADGTIGEVTPNVSGIQREVTKRVVSDLDRTKYPVKQIVPLIDTVHDRATMEIFRGCTRGCRFCQAGMVYRPVRERKPGVVKQLAADILAHTGYEELALTSLSSSDYSCISSLVDDLASSLAAKGVGLSLPSLRVDAFSVDLAKQIQKVRKSGLTFAPEAGTQRLRDVINKNVTEEDLLEAARSAFEAGWDRLKLYFMIGLPTETYEDLEGIADLAHSVIELHRKVRGNKTPAINVSVSSFVPKPHTPFQWEPQLSPEELINRQKFLRTRLKFKGMEFNWHDADVSFYEAVFSRGDRRLANVLESALSKGCKFDAWTDHFKPGVWQEAFREAGVDPCFYANRARPPDEILPWDHLKTGVSRAYLLEERRKALRGISTSDCRSQPCTGCEACDTLGVRMDLKEE